MNTTVQVISNFQLTLAFIPVVLVLLMMLHWSLKAGFAVYALIRMLIQLLLVGYVLTTVFAAEQSWVVMLVMFIMVSAASWIALGTVQAQRRQLYPLAFLSILLGGGLTLMLVTQSVIGLTPWFEPRYMIPLAGMIFANAMNSISLAAERLSAELARNIDYLSARNEAFQAAFIPTINSMLAVGLVSLPGMMTGQILSGVSPITAAHYQIVVMCMIFGGSGLSIVFFLWLFKTRVN
ncbi:iron export ABC transporter permease subunit FetB [Methylophaga thalassica]|uniref:Iron export ABC transporter permease subunit FetB n=1 Tax=Methylophaga thalassica TaxID=40223 RepID=A0ABQ5TV13_9GAMM|nr:ABC transporter permease [Methylophaga thalassica]GLP99390.1 iron export ABC transporter permease subunit FetB [Methylophaga thalassica]